MRILRISSSPLAARLASTVLFCLAASPLAAEEFGHFTYYVAGGTNTVWITDYPDDAMGEVTVPEEIDGMPVTTISNAAFEGCGLLTEITIPSTVTSIEPGAFCGCRSLEAISVGAENPSYTSDDGVLIDTVNQTVFRCPEGKVGTYMIPENLTAIQGWQYSSRNGHGSWGGGSAFENCRLLTGITIPESLVDIGNFGFLGCSGLREIEIPTGVQNIGAYAFSGCSLLREITLPNSVQTIGWNGEDHSPRGDAFKECSSLVSIDVEAGIDDFRSVDGILFNADMSEIVKVPAGKGGAYRLPDGVNSIWPEAFSGCSRLPSVTIPKVVSTIGYEAFRDCRSLESFDVDPANETYASIEGVLFDADATMLITYPGGKHGDYRIPDGVTSIDEAFFHCYALTGVTIPTSVASIRSAFHGCGGDFQSIHVDPGHANYASSDGIVFNTTATAIVRYPEGRQGAYSIPEGVTEIGGGAFSGCSGLTGVTIPEGVTRIDWAFTFCTSLTAITIPKSVAWISYLAFYGCTNLTSLIFLGDAPVGFRWHSRDGRPQFIHDIEIYYLSCSSGFTSPSWNGYPAIRIDERACPAAPWLVGHGFAYDTDLNEDTNNDGVPLIMAYALDLDPHLNLASRLPSPVVTSEEMAISFHGNSPGISYHVETSTDLKNWTRADSRLSNPGPDGMRSATIPRDSPHLFLRLAFEL